MLRGRRPPPWCRWPRQVCTRTAATWRPASCTAAPCSRASPRLDRQILQISVMFSPYIHIHVFFLFSHSLSTHAPTQLLRPSAALYLVSGHRHVTLVPRVLDTSHVTVEWVPGTRDSYNNVIVLHKSQRRGCPHAGAVQARLPAGRLQHLQQRECIMSQTLDISFYLQIYTYISFYLFKINSGYNPESGLTSHWFCWSCWQLMRLLVKTLQRRKETVLRFTLRAGMLTATSMVLRSPQSPHHELR